LSTNGERIAKQSLNTISILIVGNLSSNAILAIASLSVGRLLGPQSYGIYSLALSLPTFIELFVGLGVGGAITRYSAYYISKGDLETARRMTKNGIVFQYITSSLFTIVTILLAGFLSSVLLHRPDLTLYLGIASLLIIGTQAFQIVTQQTFLGWGLPSQVMIWTIVQSVLKLSISIGLILLGLGIIGALLGYTFSLLLTGIFGILALYILKLRTKPAAGHNVISTNFNHNLRAFLNDTKVMIRYGLPAFTGSIILGSAQQPIFTVILALIASNVAIGYYSAANVVSVAVASVTGSVVSGLFPIFSRLDGMNLDTRIAFRYAVKYSSYVIMPALIFVILTSRQVMEIIYGRAYLPSTSYLELLIISFLPLAFGQSVLSSYFNGTGHTRLTMIMSLIEALATISAVLILVLSAKQGIQGLMYSIIISNIPPTAFGLYAAKKYLGGSVDLQSLAGTTLVCFTCFLVVYLLSTFVLSGTEYIISFILELLAFLGMYLTLMPCAGVIRREDIDRLRIASRGLRILSALLNPVLRYEAFLVEHVTNK
jgi:stage V sporulation protein B